MDWVVLRKFDSQSEARVVESLLRAQGFEVQLLGTYTHAMIPIRLKGPGLRLLIQEKDLEAAEQVLEESQRATHLDVVNGTPPPISSGFDRVMMFILVLIAVLVFVIAKFR